ncbi:MAG: hypothetical protein PVS3B3_26800 [Ktedonobacteraceae bacterium]
MNSVLCRTTDAALNECVFEADRMSMSIAHYEESYVTAPMAAVQPVKLGEEELHTLFESAISSRLFAMRDQMDRISGPLPYTQLRSYETDILPVVAKQSQKLFVFRSSLQRTLLLTSLGLMLTMIGFDLMGLLVLCTR